MSYVYILQCSDGSYYVGSTTNLQLRLQEHSDGKNSYTSAHLPVKSLLIGMLRRVRKSGWLIW